MVLPTHTLVHELIFWNTDSATARSTEWRLYKERLNAGNAGEATLDEVPGMNGTWSATPGSAGFRISGATTPGYVAPGVYVLAIRNTHASNTCGIGADNTGPALGFYSSTKSGVSALGSTLDVVTGWTNGTEIISAHFRNRVFGKTAALA
jgi:hypothetical protein